MLSKFNLVLLLSTALSFATASPPSDQTNTKHTSCHNRYSPNYEMISFHNHSKPDFDFAIITKYRTYYPPVLRNALQVEKWDLTSLNKNEECGWHKARTVHAHQGLFQLIDPRGDIYWKHCDHPVERSPKSKRHPSPPVPSINGNGPSEERLKGIVNILERNEPAGDIYQTSTIILGYLCGFMAFILLLLLVKRCIGDFAEPQSNRSTNENEGIELSSIKVQSIPGSAMAHRANIPAGAPKLTRGGACEASVLSFDTICSESLPLYSVDGAGR